jgi:voltage-gated potassium channel
MRRIYEILGNNLRTGDVLGRAISISLLALIAANVFISVLESEPAVHVHAPRFFLWFERISVAIFTAEYLLRLWSCVVDPRYASPVRGRLRMLLSPMALVDLIAILPFYLDLFVPNVIDLRFLRALRLLRMFRLLRIDPLAEALTTVVRVLRRKRLQLFVSFAIVLVAIFFAAGAIYVVEHGQPETRFTSIPHAMWWSVVTVTTIGYGDMVPATAIGKIIGGLVSFIGICAVALPVGIVSSGFIEEVGRRSRAAAIVRAREPRACPHCGGDLHELEGETEKVDEQSTKREKAPLHPPLFP